MASTPSSKRLDYVRALLIGQHVDLACRNGLTVRGTLVKAAADGSYTVRYPQALVSLH